MCVCVYRKSGAFNGYQVWQFDNKHKHFGLANWPRITNDISIVPIKIVLAAVTSG